MDGGPNGSTSGSRPSSAGGGAAAAVIAGARGGSGALAMSFVGTPGYLAPAVLACTNGPGALGYGQAADMWALGCVLYEMAALRPAFADDRVPGVYRYLRRGRVPPLPGGYSPHLAGLDPPPNGCTLSTSRPPHQ